MSRAPQPTVVREAAIQLTRELMDQGRIIAAGFEMYCAMTMPPDISETQIEETRKAWFASAHHLLTSVADVLENDAEPTEDDLRRMDMIDAELRAYSDTLRLQCEEPEGTA